MKRDPRRVNLLRFATAVRDGLTNLELAERFGLHPAAVATLAAPLRGTRRTRARKAPR